MTTAPPDSAALTRAVRFLHDFARRKSPRVLPVPGGFAVLDDRYTGSYDDNKLIVTEAADPGAILAAADEVLAARQHRLVCTDDDRLGAALEPAFTAAGYTHETNLVMTFHGDPPHDPPPAERVDLGELVPVLRGEWRRTLPEATDDVVDGLARRAEARPRGAERVGFYAVRTPEGEIAAHADLYVHEGVAQIESVFTAEEHRGKGYARALLTAVLAEAVDADLIFLVADAADWPRHFYTRLGFTEAGRAHDFLRA
ncbi:Ribosomal protein S18 acetylase RimI [Nonomuraea maritima]|uniref:Ribosomal protein S18 acetylase RimI n=1 Tax=Nonomuraea maritima TaxID=683260 RepID=A0A1G9LKC8_9ACTN|nr:GNAT family N-acetyltransferase [Nonomuraea maritima]SDL62298.1 Ribosomal protein S18 acetylase RimI [Nonomuraea maritima]